MSKAVVSRAQRSSPLALTGVDGWRGVAAILVVIAHVWTNMGLTGDGLGPGEHTAWVLWVMQNLDTVVDLFFVLSGILIWLPFAAAIFSDRVEVPLGGLFFVRRVTRFLPLYLVVVTFEWALHNYNLASADWLDLLEHLTLTQSLDSKRIFYTIGPAWTLSVEWFFYLAMSFLAPGFVRWIRRTARTAGMRLVLFLIGTLPVLLGSLAFKAYVAHAHIPVTQWAWRFGPASKADIFIIGMYTGTAIVMLRGRKLPAVLLPVLLAVAGWSFARVLVPPTEDHNVYLEVIRHTVASAAFCLMLFAFTTSRWQLPARLIDNRVLMPLSVLAYSIYILHEPVLGWTEKHGLFSYAQNGGAYAFNCVLVLALSIPVAWFFHRSIEMPWANIAWLLDRDGRKRELYPHLLSEGAAPDARLLARWISHSKRRAGWHYGPSSTVTALAARLDAGLASPAVARADEPS